MAVSADRHGREATQVRDIPARGWKDVLWRVFGEISADHVMLIAAGITFYILLAMVPALTALISIYGLAADPATLNQHLAQVEGIIPGGAMQIVRDQLERLTGQGRTGLGFASLISLAVALWSANAGMKALIEGMNIAYDETEKRSFVRLTLVSLAFTVLSMIAVIAMITVLFALPRLLAAFGIGAEARLAVRIAGGIIIACVMIAGLAALYRWGPSRADAKWRWITPGAVLAVIVTLITTGLFSWYVANFGSYNATYGSLGAIIGFMTWIWITAIILVTGAELNSEAEHQTRRDTTTGAPAPLGARGAVMADTLGAATGDEAADAEAGTRRRQERHHEPAPLLRYAALLGLVLAARRRR
jgi:membrane protein